MHVHIIISGVYLPKDQVDIFFFIINGTGRRQDDMEMVACEPFTTWIDRLDTYTHIIDKWYLIRFQAIEYTSWKVSFEFWLKHN